MIHNLLEPQGRHCGAELEMLTAIQIAPRWQIEPIAPYYLWKCSSKLPYLHCIMKKKEIQPSL